MNSSDEPEPSGPCITIPVDAPYLTRWSWSIVVLAFKRNLGGLVFGLIVFAVAVGAAIYWLAVPGADPVYGLTGAIASVLILVGLPFSVFLTFWRIRVKALSTFPAGFEWRVRFEPEVFQVLKTGGSAEGTTFHYEHCDRIAIAAGFMHTWWSRGSQHRTMILPVSVVPPERIRQMKAAAQRRAAVTEGEGRRVGSSTE